MSTYLFILGKDSELSLAELRAVYPGASHKFLGRECVMVELEHKFDQRQLDSLGGTVKVALILDSASRNSLNQALFKILSNRYSGRKLVYGISIYESSSHFLRPLLSQLKKTMKQEGIKSRFVNQDYQNLSSAHHKALKKEGIELIIAPDEGNFLIGEVIAVQDIDFYSQRDYGKPYRSMRVGMLPPKLAQILINLAGNGAQRIWDPFCGGGGILLEGLLLGREMFGSDKNSEAVQGARRNIEWFKMTFNPSGIADLFIHDATKSPKNISFDAIVCEGYLGPPQEYKLHIDQLRPIVADLEKLYLDFFRALHDAKFKGHIVIAMPFFRAHEGKPACRSDREVFLDGVIKKIRELGFKADELLPGVTCLKYARQDQIVGRAIYRFV